VDKVRAQLTRQDGELSAPPSVVLSPDEARAILSLFASSPDAVRKPVPAEIAAVIHSSVLRSFEHVETLYGADEIREAVEAEREACALVAQDTCPVLPEGIQRGYIEAANVRAMKIAELIRRRSGDPK
jgi:hypothetical protein